MSLSQSIFEVLTDVTLVDEDNNSIPRDEANKAIMWRNLVAKFVANAACGAKFATKSKLRLLVKISATTEITDVKDPIICLY